MAQESDRKFNWAVFGALLAVGAAAYGRLVWNGGLFGDDTNIYFAYQQTGMDGVREFLSWSRPFSTWPYALSMPLLGGKLHAYHLLTFLLRIVCGWLMYSLVIRVFPKQGTAALYAAVLFLVYPGFSQQAHALHYLLHFSILALVLLSFILMVRAFKGWGEIRAWMLYGFSILLCLAHVSVEYFVGLELLRLLILHLVRVQGRDDVRPYPRIMWFCLPYAGLLIAYAIWRVFIFRPAYPPLGLTTLFSDGVWNGLAGFAKRVLLDMVKAGALAWGNAFDLGLLKSADIVEVISALAAGVALLLVLCNRKPNAGEDYRLRINITLLGLTALVAGGIPLWASQLPLKLTFPWDRTSLCFITGACLLMAGLLSLLPRRVSALLFILLTISCVLFQSAAALDYEADWAQVRSIIGQFTEDIPGFTTETLILYDDLPLTYYSANNLNAFFNHIYDQDHDDGIDRVKVLQISERLGNLLPALEKGIVVTHGDFSGTTSSALVFGVNEPGCVVILGAEKEPEAELPGLSNDARHLSVPGEVVDNLAEHMLHEILSPEEGVEPVCRIQGGNDG